MRRVVLLVLLAVLGAPGAAPSAMLGEQRVLLMLVTWGPEPYTVAQARQTLDETAAFVRSASFGRTSIVGEVTPWLHVLDTRPGCELERIRTAALAATRARGYDTTRYTTLGIAVPPIGCRWGGAYFDPGIWVNGVLNRHVLAHELGHTYGVIEEGPAWVCDRGCHSVPYLDPFSVMGHGWSDYGAGRSSSSAGSTASLVPRGPERSASVQSTGFPQSLKRCAWSLPATSTGSSTGRRRRSGPTGRGKRRPASSSTPAPMGLAKQAASRAGTTSSSIPPGAGGPRFSPERRSL
jgi:hypothetical protein